MGLEYAVGTAQVTAKAVPALDVGLAHGTGGACR
jgi:hypothetical protein